MAASTSTLPPSSTHSLESEVHNPSQVVVTPGGPTEEAPRNQEAVLIEEEEEEVPPLDQKWKAHHDEERIQLRIAKHNYAMDELSKGDVEADALKKWLKEVHDGPFQG
uniref:Uncharacterized protein n=1 Tax=Cannabis sativa TaxID=3483 RepID=A0A803PL72_CANSA